MGKVPLPNCPRGPDRRTLDLDFEAHAPPRPEQSTACTALVALVFETDIAKT